MLAVVVAVVCAGSSSAFGLVQAGKTARHCHKVRVRGHRGHKPKRRFRTVCKKVAVKGGGPSPVIGSPPVAGPESTPPGGSLAGDIDFPPSKPLEEIPPREEENPGEEEGEEEGGESPRGKLPNVPAGDELVDLITENDYEEGFDPHFGTAGGPGDGTIAASTTEPIEGTTSLAMTVNAFGRVGFYYEDYGWEEGPLADSVTTRTKVRVDSTSGGAAWRSGVMSRTAGA